MGAYRLLEEIGRGGMGSVYLAEHALLGRRAAIKVLQSKFSANDEAVARFFNEARAVTRIADPGIVQIFDFGHSADGRAFIIMELLEGEAMDKRLARLGRLPLADCLRFTRLLCASMAVAHASGIVHRDLKPENIFIVGDSAVTGGERVKILDFGIAKLSSDDLGTHKTRTGALMGSPVYMSPEQCRGAGEVDHRTDIYSLGCVLLTMLTGQPPFDGAGAGELIAAHLLEPPPLASSRVAGLPGAVDQLVQRCLRKSPDERFSSMAELARALEAAEPRVRASDATWPGLDATSDDPASARAASQASLAVRNPATLVGASGLASDTMARTTHWRRWIAGFAVVAIAIGGVVAVVAARSAGDANPPRGPTAAPAARGSGDLPAAAAVRAAPATGTAGAVAADPAPPAATVVPDAGVVGAPSANDSPSVESLPGHSRTPTRGPRKSSTRGDHDSSRGSAAPIKIDRAD